MKYTEVLDMIKQADLRRPVRTGGRDAGSAGLGPHPDDPLFQGVRGYRNETRETTANGVTRRTFRRWSTGGVPPVTTQAPAAPVTPAPARQPVPAPVAQPAPAPAQAPARQIVPTKPVQPVKRVKRPMLEPRSFTSPEADEFI